MKFKIIMYDVDMKLSNMGYFPSVLEVDQLLHSSASPRREVVSSTSITEGKCYHVFEPAGYKMFKY